MHRFDVRSVVARGMVLAWSIAERVRQTFQILRPHLNQAMARSIDIGDQEEGK